MWFREYLTLFKQCFYSIAIFSFLINMFLLIILEYSKCFKIFFHSAGFKNKTAYSGTVETQRSAEEHRKLADFHKNTLIISH